MNILIVNEYKVCGGAEVYVQTLTNILRNAGYRVSNLYFRGNGSAAVKDEVICTVSKSKLNKMLFNLRYYRKLRQTIHGIAPDLVILNNVFSTPLTQYLSIRGIRTIQIVHDYSIVCPKSTGITDSGEVCEGYATRNCLRECTYHGSHAQLAAKLLLVRMLAPVRRRYIEQFISPSQRLASLATAHGYNCVAIPNPLLLTLADSHAIPSGQHHYIYVGGINANKGIYSLLPAFASFARAHGDVVLDLYGAISDDDTRAFVARYTADMPTNIIYHGAVDHVTIEQVLAFGYALIVPSRCMENYPTTVLEGFARRILVIGSDRGGIPEMLSDGRGIMYPYGEAGLVSALERAESISAAEYQTLTDNGASYVLANNRPDLYLRRLLEYIR